MTIGAGVDYSTKAVHAAIVENKKLRFARRYELDGVDALSSIALMLIDLKERGVDSIIMEQPFFIPARIDKKTGKLRQGSNVHTLKLHKVPTQIETMALQGVHIGVSYVAPATWKSAILKGCPGTGTKAQSLWFAAHAHGFSCEGDDNLSDAICLATYAEALQRFRGVIPE